MLTTDNSAQIAENRRRYEALKAAGTGQAPKTMPMSSLRENAHASDPGIVLGETVPGNWYATYRLKAGERLRLINPEGTAAVALVAWNALDTSERSNHADTIKIQWTAALAKGRLIFSDMGRVLLSIVEDSCGRHDVLAGGSNRAGVLTRYGARDDLRDTRTNMVLAAGKLGLARRDIPPLITFFAPVSVADDGGLTWDADGRQSGDFVELRAEIDLLIAISNCAHPLDPTDAYTPGAVEVAVLRAAPASGDDFCRQATVEAVRGFENTDTYRTWQAL